MELLDKSYRDGSRLKKYQDFLAQYSSLSPAVDLSAPYFASTFVVPVGVYTELQACSRIMTIKTPTELVQECVMFDDSFEIIHEDYEVVDPACVKQLDTMVTTVRSVNKSIEVSGPVFFTSEGNVRLKKRDLGLRSPFEFEKKILYDYLSDVMKDNVQFMEFRGLRRSDAIVFKDFYVSPKIDGVRHLLVVNSGVMFLMDRSGKIKIAANALSFNRVVLDVEIVKDKIYVLDVLKSGDDVVLNEKFEIRLKLLKSFGIYDEYVRLQYYERISKTTSLFDLASQEGIVMIHKDCRYHLGFTKGMFKVKEGFDTIDLLVGKKDNTGKYPLFACNYKDRKFTGNVRMLHSDENLESFVNKICEFSLFKKKWTMVRARDDKAKANSRMIVEEVFCEIKNPITLLDVAKILEALFNPKKKPVQPIL